MAEDEVIQAAKKAANIPGWEPWQFETIRNGLIVTGAVCPAITRGKRKGQPNFRNPDKSTLCRVVVSVTVKGRGPIR